MEPKATQVLFQVMGLPSVDIRNSTGGKKPYVGKGAQRLVLELARPCNVRSIAFKNNNSAFVRILAGSLDDVKKENWDGMALLVPTTQLCSFEQVKNNVAAKLTKLKTFNKFSPFVCPPTAFFECLVVELHPFYDLVYNNSVGVGFINVLGLQDQSVPLKSFPAPTPGAAGAGSSGFGGSGEFKRSPSGVISSDLNQSQSQSQSSQEGGFGSPSSQPSSQAPGMRSGWGKTATAAAAAKPAQPAASKPVAMDVDEQAAPLCTKHQKPSLLRIVRNDGPDRNRGYYVCSVTEDPCAFKAWQDGKD